jgi:hypothetical protein
MARGDDEEMRVPTDMIDDPSGMFETDPMELREMLESEGMLRTADAGTIEYLKQIYNQLDDMNQLPSEYLGEEGFKKFVIEQGENILQAARERMPDRDQGIASLRA